MKNKGCDTETKSTYFATKLFLLRFFEFCFRVPEALERRKKHSTRDFVLQNVQSTIKLLEKCKIDRSHDEWLQSFTKLFYQVKNCTQFEHQTKVTLKDMRYFSICSVSQKIKSILNENSGKELSKESKNLLLIYLTQIVGNQSKLVPNFKDNKQEEIILREMLSGKSPVTRTELRSVFRLFENKLKSVVIESQNIVFNGDDSRTDEFISFFKEYEKLCKAVETKSSYESEKVQSMVDVPSRDTFDERKSVGQINRANRMGITGDGSNGKVNSRSIYNGKNDATVELAKKPRTKSTAVSTDGSDDVTSVESTDESDKITIGTIVASTNANDDVTTTKPLTCSSKALERKIAEVEKLLKKGCHVDVKNHFLQLYKSIRKELLHLTDAVFYQGLITENIGVPNEFPMFTIYVVIHQSNSLAVFPSTANRYWLKDLRKKKWVDPSQYFIDINNSMDQVKILQENSEADSKKSTGYFHEIVLPNQNCYTTSVIPAIVINSCLFIPSEHHESIDPPCLWKKCFEKEVQEFYETVEPSVRTAIRVVRYILTGLGSFDNFPWSGLITVTKNICMNTDSNNNRVASKKTMLVLEMLREVAEHLAYGWLACWFEPSHNLLSNVDSAQCTMMHIDLIKILSDESRFLETVDSIKRFSEVTNNFSIVH